MTIHIKFAETTSELDGLFRLRHRVYVEENHYMAPTPDGRIYDRFDAYPSTTCHGIAVDDSCVIGGVRFVEATVAGTPADDFFDFSPFIPLNGSKMGSGSMLCLKKDYQKISGLASSLMGMGYCWALLELRQRIIDTVDQQYDTIEEITEFFGVTEQYIYNP